MQVRDLTAVELEACEELATEEHRRQVALAKERIRAQMGRPWWKRLFPYTITITKD